MAAQEPGKGLVCRLGRLPYDQAIVLEEGLLKLRAQGRLPDVLLLMEHPPTVTLGRFGKMEHVLLPPEELAARGIAFAHSTRGGETTFHCPGQLVLHAVMDLRRREGTLRGFITDLEEAALRVLAGYGIPAARWREHPGLWVAERQIGAIGLRVSHGVSMHGLALNVCPELSSFNVIDLCGLPGREPTSIARETGRPVRVAQVARRLQASLAEVFHITLAPVSKAALAKQVAADVPCPAA